MIVKSAGDVGVGSRVRVSHPNGQVFEDRVVAVLGERVLLERGLSVDPRRSVVKVVSGRGGAWRAVEHGEAMNPDELALPAAWSDGQS